LRPGKISARSFVPDHIKRPDYALNNNGTPFEEINSKFQEIIEVKDFK
jgi:methionyl aminopeptidase